MTHPGSLYFGEWLDAYDGDDSAIADLRDDFKRSYRFRKLGPLDFKTPRRVEIDLMNWKACSEAFEALKAAAEIYHALPGAWSRPSCPHCFSWITPDNPEPKGKGKGCLECIDKI